MRRELLIVSVVVSALGSGCIRTMSGGGSETAPTPSPTISGTGYPNALNDAYTSQEDTPLVVVASNGVLANDHGASSILAAWLVSPPSHGRVSLAADGSFAYTPALNFNGTDSFTYQAEDGARFSLPATATITVTPVNDPPAGVADQTATDVMLPVALDLLTNDSDVDGDPLAVSSYTQPAHGSVISIQNGVLYTPAAGFAGADGFQYVVSDGQGGATTVPVSVSVRMPIDLDSTSPTELVSASAYDCPSISGDGRFVVFDTGDPNLLPGDTNNAIDVFLRDRASATTAFVSLGPTGALGNGHSTGAVVSSSGRFVAFISAASNLVANDVYGRADVFVRDLATGANELASVSSSGAQATADSFGTPAISADGRFVAFSNLATNLDGGNYNADIFVRDRGAGTTKRVSVDSSGIQGNGGSYLPAISGDGRFAAFVSFASNLIANDANNGNPDLFVHDLQTGVTELVDQRTDGVQAESVDFAAPSISADGRYVAFSAMSAKLDPADAGVLVSRIFVRDRVAGTLTLVSAAAPGYQVFDHSLEPSISADGRYIAFRSAAAGLVAGLSPAHDEIFVRDRITQRTAEVSVSASGMEANGPCDCPHISADGRYVTFRSLATNFATLPPLNTGTYQIYTVRNSLAP